MVSPALEALYQDDAERAASLRGPDASLPAYEAAAFGRVDRLRALLDADPAAANERSPDGFSPLHLAIYGRSADAARLLIARGANVDALSEHEQIKVRP